MITALGLVHDRKRRHQRDRERRSQLKGAVMDAMARSSITARPSSRLSAATRLAAWARPEVMAGMERVLWKEQSMWRYPGRELKGVRK
jgi:hypothetical protein